MPLYLPCKWGPLGGSALLISSSHFSVSWRAIQRCSGPSQEQGLPGPSCHEWVFEAAYVICLGLDRGEGGGAGPLQAPGKGCREKGGICDRPGLPVDRDMIGHY